MTPQQIVGLFVRLFAIWLVVQALQLVGVGIEINRQPLQEQWAGYYYTSAIVVVVAAALWLFPMVVAHKLIPRTQFDNVLRVPAHEAAIVACIVLGLWLFVARALPLLTHYFTVAALLWKNHISVYEAEVANPARLIEGVVTLLVCGFLTFKARFIANCLLLPRTDKEDES
ncbi:MAG: hypothetical protein FWH15_02250 [Betaproteobacteria bacterium]|nr:hypothetical protein [Betaproteobacteria bacterium]